MVVSKSRSVFPVVRFLCLSTAQSIRDATLDMISASTGQSIRDATLDMISASTGQRNKCKIEHVPDSGI